MQHNTFFRPKGWVLSRLLRMLDNSLGGRIGCTCGLGELNKRGLAIVHNHVVCNLTRRCLTILKSLITLTILASLMILATLTLSFLVLFSSYHQIKHELD